MRIESLVRVCCRPAALRRCGGPKPRDSQNQRREAAADTSNIKIDGDPSTPGEQARHRGHRRSAELLGRGVPEALRRGLQAGRGRPLRADPGLGVGPGVRGQLRRRRGQRVLLQARRLGRLGRRPACCPTCRRSTATSSFPIVLAHEWGHAMQQRSGFFDQNELTVSSELQADCFAGGWSKHAQDDEGLRRQRRRPRQGPGGHPRPARQPGHQRPGPVGARQRLRPRQRLPGRLRQRRREVQGLQGRRADRARTAVQRRRGRGQRWRGAVRLDRQRRAVRPRGLLDARSIPS